MRSLLKVRTKTSVGKRFGLLVVVGVPFRVRTEKQRSFDLLI